MTRCDGPDVSKYQGAVDWVAVRAGCGNPDAAVAVWKVTQGIRTIDSTAVVNRQGAEAAGFRWRFGYHWLSPNVDATAQADWFLANFWPGASEGMILDAEEAGITTAQCRAWCDRVLARTGRSVVVVYTGVYVAGGTIWRDTQLFDGSVARWVAAYVLEAKVRAACAPYGFDVWQYTSTGTIAGIANPCDLNFVEHPAMLDRACNLTATPAPPVAPVQPSGDDEMLTLYQDTRYANVFLVGSSATTVGPELFASLKARGVPHITGTHDQSLVAYMRQSRLTMKQMVRTGGTPDTFIPPSDLA